MTNQLFLVDDESDAPNTDYPDSDAPDSDALESGAPELGDPNEFRLDERTRAIGRVGIAAARQALADAVRRAAERDHPVAA